MKKNKKLLNFVLVNFQCVKKEKVIKILLKNVGIEMHSLTASLILSDLIGRFVLHIYYLYFIHFFIKRSVIVRFCLDILFQFSPCPRQMFTSSFCHFFCFGCVIEKVPRMRDSVIGYLVVGIKQLGVDVHCYFNSFYSLLYINAKGSILGE